MMTTQEMYSKVRKHLLTQNAKSVDNTTCMYRGPEGRMCAAGVLIKDEFYRLEFETLSVDNGPVIYALTASGVDQEDLVLLRELQKMHDDSYPESWEGELNGIAFAYGLMPE